MACGLGAIILVFMLIKHNVDQPEAKVDPLKLDLAQLREQNAALKALISRVDANALSEMKRIGQNQAAVTILKSEMTKKTSLLSDRKVALSAVKKKIENTPVAKKDDVVKNDRGGEENYVMGIRVEGRKIILLIDSSASMTDEKLIQIIRRKNGSDKDKKGGPKWQRTKRIARWLLARTPKSSQISVVIYNRKARVLGAVDWFYGRDTSSIQRIYSDLDRLVPTGSTNLQLGLQKATALKPTDIYVITDGLPTDGQSRYSSLNPFAACSSLLGKSSNISGQCRVKLFRQSIYESSPGSGVKINVILLPLEGDPQAAPEYWAWSASTGGLLISPALSWP